MRSLRSAAAITLVALLCSALAGAGERAEPALLENVGQWPDHVLFARTEGGAGAWLTTEGLWIATRDARGAACVELVLERAGRPVRLAPAGERLLADAPARHYFLGSGSTPKSARSYRAVRCANVAPGVDFVVRATRAGVAYDLELAAGARADELVLACRGLAGLEPGSEPESLGLCTAAGTIRHGAPRAFEVGRDGERRALDVRLKRLGPERFGFVLHGRDPARAALIDPDLVWSTFLGGDVDQRVLAVRALPSGRVLAAGATTSSNFPTKPGSFDPFPNGAGDGFVSLLEADASTLVWSTFLGGSGLDEVKGLAVGPNGEITVAGETASTNFPTTPGAFDTSANGQRDGFVTRLAATGDVLVWSTYLGGSQHERCNAVDVDAAGRATVGGASLSQNFPTTLGSLSTSLKGGQFVGDGFVTRIEASGATLAWSTFLGGAGEDFVADLVLEPNGSTFCCGVTSSPNFPVAFPGFDFSLSGVVDGFVSRLAGDGKTLVSSTYLGGSGSETLNALALDSGGDVVVVGSTDLAGYPLTANVVDTSFDGASEGVVTRLLPDLSALVFSTYVGGLLTDRVEAVTVETTGNVVVGGATTSLDFATTPGAYDRTYNDSVPPLGFEDAFLTRYDPQGAKLGYSTYIGHHDNDEILALATHPTGAVVLGGRTSSFFFPTTAGVVSNFYGFTADGMGFVSLFDMLVGPIAYGVGKTTSQGGPGGLGSSGFPSVADGNLTLDVQAVGLAFRPGVLLQGSGPATLPFYGAVLNIAPPIRRIGIFQLDFIGFASELYPLQASQIGTKLYFQAWFKDPGDPLGFGLTNGLEVFVHP